MKAWKKINHAAKKVTFLNPAPFFDNKIVKQSDISYLKLFNLTITHEKAGEWQIISFKSTSKLLLIKKQTLKLQMLKNIKFLFFWKQP